MFGDGKKETVTHSTDATFRGTRGHIGWDIVHKNPFPWSA